MKILFCGDVVGRAGRDAVIARLPRLRDEYALDFIIVNTDNAAGGFGVTADVCRDFFKAGAHVLTGGDHIWDQKEIVPYMAQEKRLLRPENFPARTPGAGHGLFETRSGRRIAVLHLLGQVFHREYAACPFAAADRALEHYRLGGNVNAIFVDFHAEATSEKTAMGHYLDGRVSAVIGSHTHVPTHDARLLPKGAAYQTDAGMCGDYNSVIGFEPGIPLERFLTKIHKGLRLTPGAGEGTLCGAIVETEDETGLARAITPLRLGGVWD